MDAKLSFFAFPLLLLCPLCGCQPQAAPTPPVNVTALATELGNLQQELATLLTASSADEGQTDGEGAGGEVDIEVVASDSHQMLHRVGAILAKLGKLQNHPDFSDEQCAEIASLANRLADAYGQVDTAIHEGEVPDYGAVEETITESITALRETVSSSSDAPAQ